MAAEAARVLDVAEEPGRPMLATLGAHLKAKRALLILDNCEHLIKPSADLAHAIVKNAPHVRMIASSREPLHVPGEKTYPILPLPVPDRLASLEVLRATPSVQLFVQRAQAHKPAFELNEREAPAVAELVARLEGIPLALELAAARVRAMSVADINKRLTDRYKILTGGSRVLQERQQTLRALVDWSYELLQDHEKLLLRRLAVFVGGFDLEAAEKVCGVEPIEDFEVLDLLGSLVDKSLVMAEERVEGTRYRMLETIRDYAADKLRTEGEDADAAARHNDHYFELAKQANRGLDGAEQGVWIHRLELEQDNLRAAIALVLGGAVDPVRAVKFAVALQGFWELRSYATEGRRVVKAALALPEVEAWSLAKAHALYVGAALALSQSDHAEARAQLETCLALRRELDEPIDTASTLSALSLAHLQAGDTRSASASEAEALEISRSQGDRLGEAIGLLHLAQIAIFDGDLERARPYLEQGLALSRELDYRETEGLGELLLGRLAAEERRADDAGEHYERSLALCRDAADKRGEANALALASRWRRRGSGGAHGWRPRCRPSAPPMNCWAVSRTMRYCRTWKADRRAHRRHRRARRWGLKLALDVATARLDAACRVAGRGLRGGVGRRLGPLGDRGRRARRPQPARIDRTGRLKTNSPGGRGCSIRWWSRGSALHAAAARHQHQRTQAGEHQRVGLRLGHGGDRQPGAGAVDGRDTPAAVQLRWLLPRPKK